mgnify:FL=1
MSQSLSCVLLHIIFSTKDKYPFIQPDIETDLFSYTAAIARKQGCPAIIINGMPDHIHVFCNLSRTITIAQLVEEVKTSTSKWIKSKSPDYQKFQWQTGYGVFSVSQSKMMTVKGYVENQKEHHRMQSFREEYRIFLREYGVAYDERYVWD